MKSQDKHFITWQTTVTANICGWSRNTKTYCQ